MSITKLVAGMALCALTACGSARGPGAEDAYNIVEGNHGSIADLCREATKVAQGYLDDRNQDLYQIWSIRRDSNCARARMER